MGIFPICRQGFYYLVNSLAWDPVTLTAMTLLVRACLRRGAPASARAIALGVVLHTAYVVRIGGDYTSGRFLTPALVAAMAIAGQVDLGAWYETLAATAIALLIGLTSPRPPLLTTDTYAGLGSSPQSIDDERGYRAGATALLRVNKDHGLAAAGGWVANGVAAKDSGKKVAVYKNIGFYGFFVRLGSSHHRSVRLGRSADGAHPVPPSQLVAGTLLARRARGISGRRGRPRRDR